MFITWNRFTMILKIFIKWITVCLTNILSHLFISWDNLYTNSMLILHYTHHSTGLCLIWLTLMISILILLCTQQNNDILHPMYLQVRWIILLCHGANSTTRWNSRSEKWVRQRLYCQVTFNFFTREPPCFCKIKQMKG